MALIHKIQAIHSQKCLEGLQEKTPLLPFVLIFGFGVGFIASFICLSFLVFLMFVNSGVISIFWFWVLQLWADHLIFLD